MSQSVGSSSLKPVLPFLRWAGAKRWLSPHLKFEFDKISGRYIEPFLGSGSMFFAVGPTNSVLADTNKDLVSAFIGIRDNPEAVYGLLQGHADQHGPDYFLSMSRQRFDDVIFEAARFIYVNRTCFNGIYRVNSKNIFNVPIGRDCKVLLPGDDFVSISHRLQGSTILNEDFVGPIRSAGDGDFVFADPPYTVKHNNNGFVAYNEKIFSWGDQERLASELHAAHLRGAKVIATNAAHESIYDLYLRFGFHIVAVERASKISGVVAARGRYKEYILSSFPIDLSALTKVGATVVA